MSTSSPAAPPGHIPDTGTSTGIGVGADAESVSSKRMWLILIVVLIADALDLIDTTISNVAAPSVVADLGGGDGLVKWLGASYALALGSLLVLGGRLGDRYGQRRVFLTGIAGFTIASTVAGLAFDPTSIIVARAVQGAFGALLIPQGMAILTRTFPREALQKAFGAFGPMLGIFAVGGPVLAGFIIDADFFGLGWRPMFLINIILGGFALVLAWRIVPQLDPDPETRIDILGSVLLAGGVFSLLFGLIEGSEKGWDLMPLTFITAAVVLAALFVRRQLTTAQPLIKTSLFRNKGFTSGLAMGLLLFAAFNGLMYVISLFFQLGLGYSPSRASLALLPLTVGIIIGAGASMGLIAKVGRTLVLIGLLTTSTGAGLMLYLVRASGLEVGSIPLIIVTLIIGIGAGLCFSSVFDTALGDLDQDEAGAASGSLTAVQQIANGIGSATVTSVYFAALATGQIHAMTISLIAVLGLCALALVAVPLLPRKAADIEH